MSGMMTVSEVRRWALRLELAEGHLQTMRKRRMTTAYDLEQAVIERDGSRDGLRQAVEDATGCDPGTLCRMLAL